MPVIITKNNVDYYLIPAPLVSFNKQTYNNIGRPGFGSDYSISLQGTLVQTHGNPYYSGATAGLSTASWTTTSQVESQEITVVSGLQGLDATIKKQELIRSLFSNPVVSGVAKPIKVTIRGWDEDPTRGSGISFYGFVDDLSFDSDGRWANPGSYTVNLRNASFLQSAAGQFPSGYNENVQSGYSISSLNETFDIQEEGRTTLNFISSSGRKTLQSTNKVYTVNRSVTAVGSPIYNSNGGYLNNLAPWQQASGFVYQYLGFGSGIIASNLSGARSSAVSSLINGNYNAANFVYQENIDKEAGTYSLTETCLIYSGAYPVIENITINHDIGENETNTVNVQGTIQGLNTFNGFASSGSAYANAHSYWTGVVDTGTLNNAYYYAKGILPSANSWLHPKPLSKSIARDFGAGTVSYTYGFDDRPPNMIPGSISESIQVNDTYPGEIFSVTPVIGRSQPVLQYLNSRSEYKRNLSINITMGQTGIPSWQTNGNGLLNGGASANRAALQAMFITEKPSISQTSALNEIFQAVNPINDPYFTVAQGKCFHSAPTESWDARTRNYTYSIEWTYERT